MITKENWRELARLYHQKVCPEFNTEYEGRYLALELGGEVGELQNIVKKLWRGNHPKSTAVGLTNDLIDEVADVYIVINLLADCYLINLDEVAASKVEILMERIGES